MIKCSYIVIRGAYHIYRRLSERLDQMHNVRITFPFFLFLKTAILRTWELRSLPEWEYRKTKDCVSAPRCQKRRLDAHVNLALKYWKPSRRPGRPGRSPWQEFRGLHIVRYIPAPDFASTQFTRFKLRTFGGEEMWQIISVQRDERVQRKFVIPMRRPRCEWNFHHHDHHGVVQSRARSMESGVIISQPPYKYRPEIRFLVDTRRMMHFTMNYRRALIRNLKSVVHSHYHSLLMRMNCDEFLCKIVKAILGGYPFQELPWSCSDRTWTIKQDFALIKQFPKDPRNEAIASADRRKSKRTKNFMFWQLVIGLTLGQVVLVLPLV